MSAKRITIGRTFSQTPLENDTPDSQHNQTFVLATGKRALFRFERIAPATLKAKHLSQWKPTVAIRQA